MPNQAAALALPSPARLPPGPAAPAVLQTIALVRDSFGYLVRCAERYGDAFTVRMSGIGPVVHLSHPDDLRAMFTAGADVARAGEVNHLVFGPVTGTGSVFTMDDGDHLRRRKLLVPPFHGERMHHYARIIEETTIETMRGWPQGKPFSIHPEVQYITLQVILRAVFGLGAGPEAQRLTKVLTRLANDAIGSPILVMPFLHWDLGPLSPWGRVVRIVRDARAAVLEEIARRRAERAAAPNERREDILSMLLDVTDEDGQPLPDQAICDELLVVLSAGHETTATTLAWTFAAVLASPDVLRAIRTELAEVLADRPVDRDSLAKLPYLDAVIKEAMRLRPIMLTAGGRRLTEPLVLRNHRIPAGAIVTNSEFLLHRRADLYPDPTAFKPERFLDRKVDPYGWAPFGGGGRRCLGMAFALYEMKVVLATVLRRCELTLASDPNARGRRGFFIAPADGLRVTQAHA